MEQYEQEGQDGDIGGDLISMDANKAATAADGTRDGTREATAEEELDGCVEASEHTNAGHVSPIAAFRTGKSTSFGRCLDL
jgi:hypothetical protein